MTLPTDSSHSAYVIARKQVQAADEEHEKYMNFLQKELGCGNRETLRYIMVETPVSKLKELRNKYDLER